VPCATPANILHTTALSIPVRLFFFHRRTSRLSIIHFEAWFIATGVLLTSLSKRYRTSGRGHEDGTRSSKNTRVRIVETQPGRKGLMLSVALAATSRDVRLVYGTGWLKGLKGRFPCIKEYLNLKRSFRRSISTQSYRYVTCHHDDIKVKLPPDRARRRSCDPYSKKRVYVRTAYTETYKTRLSHFFRLVDADRRTTLLKYVRTCSLSLSLSLSLSFLFFFLSFT